MSNFLDNLEDKIAFKKAIRQLDEEQSSKRSTVTRVYHNAAFSMPQKDNFTDFATNDTVDTNYFKKWREDYILEPGNHETIIETKRIDYDEDDVSADTNDVVNDNAAIVTAEFDFDNEKEAQENISAESKDKFIDLMDQKNELKRDNTQEFSDFKSFLLSKQKAIQDEVAHALSKQKSELNDVMPALVDKKETSDSASKIDQEENKKDRQEIKDKLDEILKSITETKNNNKTAGNSTARRKSTATSRSTKTTMAASQPLKVVPKKTTSKSTGSVRKTRGKAKRKLDSDIVKIVDWRD